MNKAFVVERLQRVDMSQAELARRMGIDKSQITRLLNGERDLKAKEVRLLAQILNTTEVNILNNLGETQ